MKLKLTVDGKVYEVEVETSEPEQPRPSYVPPTGQESAPVAPSGSSNSAPPAGDEVADESKVCRSPVSGIVVRVPTQAGQDIQVDDVLMVLEAMKMETTITAPIAGTITKLNVSVGDSVRNGQVLVEFE